MEPFNSGGVYFRHMGTLKIRTGFHYMLTPINIQIYERAFEKYSQTASQLFQKCTQLNLDCSSKYQESQTKLKELHEKIDKIFEVLGQRRRRNRVRRWCSWLFCGIHDYSDDIHDIRWTIRNNFETFQRAQENQNRIDNMFQVENKEFKYILNDHGNKIHQNNEKILNNEISMNKLSSKMQENSLLQNQINKENKNILNDHENKIHQNTLKIHNTEISMNNLSSKVQENSLLQNQINKEIKNSLNDNEIEIHQNTQKIHNIEMLSNKLNSKMQENAILQNQINKEIKNTLNFHESKLNQQEEKINELINSTIILNTNIEKSELVQKFDKFNTEIFEIQTKAGELLKIVEDIVAKNFLSPQVLTNEDLVDYIKLKIEEKQLLYPPIYENVPKIRKILSTFAFYETGLIIVVLKIPLFSPDALQIYEPLTLPIFSKNKVILIDNKLKYCALSNNFDRYHCGKDFDNTIQKLDDFYLAEEINFPLYDSLKKDNCLINIFRGTSIEKCKFKYLNENIEIFHNLGDKYLYAIRDMTRYFYECGTENNRNRDDTLNGTGILKLPKNCEFSTDKKESILKGLSEVSGKSSDRYKFGLDYEISKKVGNLTLPKGYTALTDKEVLPKLTDLNERGEYFVPEIHWFLKFLRSKVFLVIVTIIITSLILAAFVYIIFYYPRYANVRKSVRVRIQSIRIRRRRITPEPNSNVNEIVEFFENKNKKEEEPMSAKGKNTENKKRNEQNKK